MCQCDTSAPSHVQQHPWALPSSFPKAASAGKVDEDSGMNLSSVSPVRPTECRQTDVNGGWITGCQPPDLMSHVIWRFICHSHEAAFVPRRLGWNAAVWNDGPERTPPICCCGGQITLKRRSVATSVPPAHYFITSLYSEVLSAVNRGLARFR